MKNHESLNPLFEQSGCTGYKWIPPAEVVVSQWVRMKCMFGCPSYGRIATCPPNTPTISECRAFFSEYADAVILHFAKKLDRPEDEGNWSLEVSRKLAELERRVFLAGYRKAFLLTLDECRLCPECPGERARCLKPAMARPSMESMGIDVFATVQKCGFPIQTLDGYDNTMNRYAMIMID